VIGDDDSLEAVLCQGAYDARDIYVTLVDECFPVFGLSVIGIISTIHA
jgi:hypothetical protein